MYLVEPSNNFYGFQKVNFFWSTLSKKTSKVLCNFLKVTFTLFSPLVNIKQTKMQGRFPRFPRVNIPLLNVSLEFQATPKKW